jgi:hypothetical protein
MTTPWSMSKDDVIDSWTSTSSSSQRAGRVARTSRKTSHSGSILTLIHMPTEIRVTGAVPVGHYSRHELMAQRERLRGKLWEQLEVEVARKLRIPGR